MLTYEGSGVLAEDEAARIEGLQFIAHEAAHFWLGQTVAYEYARDAWITEGGADLLAMRLTASEHAELRLARRLQPFDRGLRGPHAPARHRDARANAMRSRAYYACGAVFGLIAESASGRSFFTFVKKIIDANRADGIVTRAEWLAALDSASRKPDLSRDIARLLDRGVPDPRRSSRRCSTRAGVAHSIDAEGMPRLP